MDIRYVEHFFVRGLQHNILVSSTTPSVTHHKHQLPAPSWLSN